MPTPAVVVLRPCWPRCCSVCSRCRVAPWRNPPTKSGHPFRTSRSRRKSAPCCRNMAASSSMRVTARCGCPTVTPQGWHPYPPCHWVKTKQYGWYYDDKTPWGQIVHHYGRWFFDQQIGWAWDPGSEFSPGWVVWRTSPEWWAGRRCRRTSRSRTSRRISSTTAISGFSSRPRSSTTAASRRRWLRSNGFRCCCARPNGSPRSQFVDGIVVIVLPPYVIGPHRHREHRILSVAGLVHGPDHDRLQFRVAEDADFNVATSARHRNRTEEHVS